MANRYIDDVMPKMKAMKDKFDRHEDISGAEIAQLRKAIADAATTAFPSKDELTKSRTPCVACLLCGFWDPPFLGFTAAV